MKKIWGKKKKEKPLQLLIAWVYDGATLGGGKDGVEEDGQSRGRGRDTMAAEGEEEKSGGRERWLEK